MKYTKDLRKLFFLILSLFLVGCSKEDCLYFTVDETVSDIITGKQIKLGNSLTIYSDNEYIINVNGSSGKITVASANEKIATAKTLPSIYLATSVDRYSISIKGIAVGSTSISVYDEDNKSAKLNIIVKDGESLWNDYASYTIKKDSRRCEITGVDDETAKSLSNEIMTGNHNHKFLIKKRNIAEVSMYRLQIYDENDNLIQTNAYGYIEPTEKDFCNGKGTIKEEWHFYDNDILMKSYVFYVVISTEGEKYLVEDISADYNNIYPNIKTYLYMPY